MIEFSKLPFNNLDLEPIISSHTLSFHYDKHHKTYVDNLNKLIENTDFTQMSLWEIILQTTNKTDKTAIFNNAAQIWNHEFYWKSLSPNNNYIISKNLQQKINDFGGIEEIQSQLKSNGLSQFGSGWVWLVFNKITNKIFITKTSNADIPNINGDIPLFTIDVWEHAYYLDYQNRRGDYLSEVISNMINWKFIDEQFNII